MEMKHTYTFKGMPKNVLRDTIQDQDVLKKVLPGCDVFKEVEENVYEASLNINMGPVKGKFSSDVKQVDMEEPDFYRLLVKASGKPGEIDADAAMSFEETDEGTVLTCNATVNVTGLLASVGQRIMGGVAKVVIGQFFKDIEKEANKM